MSNTAHIYRDEIMRATVGVRPAMLAQPVDAVALDRICQRLVDDEEAASILLHKGWAKPGQSLADVVRQLPAATL